MVSHLASKTGLQSKLPLIPSVNFDIPSLTTEQKSKYEELYSNWNDEWKAKLKNASSADQKKIRNEWWVNFQDEFQALLNAQGRLNLAKPGTESFKQDSNIFSKHWQNLNTLISISNLQTRLPSIENASWVTGSKDSKHHMHKMMMQKKTPSRRLKK